MQKVITALRGGIERSDRVDPMRNILEKLLKACEEGKVFTSSEPLTILVSAAIGGVFQKVDLRDGSFVVAATTPSDNLVDAERFAEVFRGLGFVCELRRRAKRPAKARKGEAAPSVAAVPEIIHILYIQG